MSIEPGRVQQFALFTIALLALFVAFPVSDIFAQDELGSDLDELKDQREENAREAALAAADIDVVTATVEEVTQALDEIAALVEIQQIRLGEAQDRYESSLGAVEQAESDREDILTAAGLLREHLSNLAVASFTGESGTAGDEMTELILSDDPGEAARFIHLLELQTGSLNDGLDRLRALEAEAESLIIVQEQASLRAEESLAEVEARTAELEEAEAQQAQLVASAELRLEAQLAEAAFLEERDEQLATLIRDEQTAINNRIAANARSQGIEIPPPVDLDDIVLISFYRPGEVGEPTVDPETGELREAPVPLDVEPFFQIEVHVDIEEQTRQLYQRAFDQGIDLGGWGYRPIQRQVELRAAHCGGSQFDIWHRPAFECSPPTARPGFSKHEQGRAIDFQWNGGGIGTQNSEAFRWLQANAPQFGFVNLPSEPWHWSIDPGDERLPGS